MDFPQSNEPKHSSFIFSKQQSFNKSNQQFLLSYLTKQFGFSEKTAMILIETHNCTTLPEALDLFLRDQENLYQHVFIPNEQQICEICGQVQNQHKKIAQLSDQSIDSFLEEHMDREKIYNPKKYRKVEGYDYQCQICCLQFPKQKIVQVNGIVHQICLQCMNIYLTEQIMNMRVERLSCPHCYERLKSQTIQQYVSATTFSKYREFLRNAQINNNPNLRWCPNPKCSVIIQLQSKKSTIKCPKCEVEICTKCNRLAHPKVSCQKVFQNQIKQWENASDIQKCKKCKAMVQKISGCNHMSCSVCHYQWCWLCNAQYTENHFNPLNPFGCPGLQDSHHSEWGKCKIYVWKIFLLFLFIFLVPILIPLVLIFAGPGILITIACNSNCWYYRSCFPKFLIILVLIPIGILIDPIAWIVLLIIILPKLIQACIDQYRRRRQMNQYSDDTLRRRLLRQSILGQFDVVHEK